jgi:flagellar protein FlaI
MGIIPARFLRRSPGVAGLAMPRPRVQPPEPIVGSVVDTYRVPGTGSTLSADVFIVDDEGFGRCLIRPPALSVEEKAALGTLRSNLLESVPVGLALSPRAVLEEYVRNSAPDAGIGGSERETLDRLLYHLLREFVGYWEVDPLMNDDMIEEISVTRYDKPVRILHRDYTEYGFMETDVRYETEGRLQAFVRRLAQLGGTTISLAQPSLEVTLHDSGDRRVTATLGDEITRPGSTYSIRKQREHPMTVAQLTAGEQPKWRPPETVEAPAPVLAYEEVHSHKTLSVLMAAYFWLLLERTTNVLVAGETNSGKTTMMNAILALMNPKAKIVTAEDVLEINLPEHLHWQRMKTRYHRAGLSPMSQRYEYGLGDLLKLSLRFSPTLLSLGEMRGEESEVLAAAITLGFSTMTTIHAENAERTVQRLTTPPMRFAEGHVRDITAIATMRKVALADGRVARRLVSVDEIRPVGPDGHVIVNVFRYDHGNDSFEPTTPAEVMDRSYRLGEIAQSFGWTPARVQRGLAARAAWLSKRVAEGSWSAESISAMVGELAKSEIRGAAGGQ